MYINPEKKIKFINLPYGDKSITHRYFICAALANTKSVITNANISMDTLATADCLTALGAKFVFEGRKVTVMPITKPKTNVTLNCFNSGTTARLLSGVVAGLNIAATFKGDDSLSKRPMERVITPLKLMGANIQLQPDCLFKILPSKLHGINYQMPIASAQVKSAILLAGLFAEGETTVSESIPTRNHTECALKHYGAQIDVNEGTIKVNKSRLKGRSVFVPNDFSTAAYLIAVGLKKGIKLKKVGINPTRRAFLDMLVSSGAKIIVKNEKEKNGEKFADINVYRSSIRPFISDAIQSAAMIDEIPVACLTAALAQGESVFYGVEELAVKESDRIQSIIALLKAFGVKAKYEDNALKVNSKGILKGGKDIPFTNDHRIVMTGIVGALLSRKGIQISDIDCIDVSCPNFLQLLDIKPFKLGLIGSDIKQSKSPLIYQILSQITGIKTEYSLLTAHEENFDEVYKKAKNSCDGINLTMPFKKRLNGEEVNTVACIGEKTLLYNTDASAVAIALKSKKISVKGKNLLVIGCGGAATAAIKKLIGLGALITVRNRTESKAQELTKHWKLFNDKNFFGILSFIPIDYLSYVSKNEILNANFVFDAYYFTQTALVREAKLHKKNVIDGFNMLLNQAFSNFEIWTGKKLTANQKRKAEAIFRSQNEDTRY
jgi:3-phosphoshikimate 1-carboxyvinyltransferase